MNVQTDGRFTYVIVLVSIITALAIRSILTGFSWIITCRREIRLYPLHLIGAVLVFLLLIQGWWGTFSKRLLTEWNFVAFLVLLMTPILYFLVAELLFPSRKGPEMNFRDHYWENFRWFYGISAAIQLNNILTDRLMPTDESPRVANLIRLSAFVLLAVMASVKRSIIHYLVYIVLACLFVAFVVKFNLKI